MNCVFCAIVLGAAPANGIYEDENCVAFLDIRPVSRGHSLVVPKRHITDLTDAPEQTLSAMMAVAQRIARAARTSELAADGNNVLLNDGRAAFQTVPHIHLHVVPRHAGHLLSFVKGAVVRRDPDRETTAAMLRDALARPNADKPD